MHCTEPHATRTRLLQPLAAAVLGVAGLFLLPAANAQMNQRSLDLRRNHPGAITFSDHFGSEADCGCGGLGAGDQHQAGL